MAAVVRPSGASAAGSGCSSNASCGLVATTACSDAGIRCQEYGPRARVADAGFPPHHSSPQRKTKGPARWLALTRANQQICVRGCRRGPRPASGRARQSPGVTHAVEHLEHDQRAGAFVRAAPRSRRSASLPKGRRFQTSCTTSPALVDGQHRARRESVRVRRDSARPPGTGRLRVASSAMAMMLAVRLSPVGRMRREAQRRFAVLLHQPVATQRLARAFGEHRLGHALARSVHHGGGRRSGLVTDHLVGGRSRRSARRRA